MAVEFEAALHLIGKDDASAMLRKVMADVLGLHTGVTKLNDALKQITSGAIKIGAALGMAEFIADLNTANGLLERQINIFKLAGNSAADAEAMRKAAYQSAIQVRGVDVVEQAKLARELSAALQDNPGALKVLPDFAKAKAVIGVATGRDDEDMTTRIAKMIELRGGAINETTQKLDPELFRKELNAATKALIAGQGLISANDLQQMIKQAGAAGKNFRGNPEAFWRDYLAAAEDMGGSRAGTAITAVARQYLGGIMTPKVAEEFNRLGMLNKEGWHEQKGKIVIDDPSKAIKGYQELLHGGVRELVEKVIRPTLDAHGYNTDEKRNAELYSFASTETARRLLGLYLSNAAQIKAVGERYDKTSGTEGFDKVVKGDFLYNVDAIGKSFHTLATSLGAAAQVAPMLGGIADGINKLAAAAAAHPAIGSTITFGGGAAAAGLGIYGAYQVGKGIKSALNGFGLPAAATELTVAAKLLDSAATKLLAGPGGARALVPFAAAEAATGGGLGPKTANAIGWFRKYFLGVNLASLAFGAGDAFKDDGKGHMTFEPIYGKQVDAFNKWYQQTMSGHWWSRIMGVDPAEAGKHFGPSRVWVGPQVTGRGTSLPGHWDLDPDDKIRKGAGLDFSKTMKDAALDATKSFKAANFAGAGKDAGDQAAKGFKTANFKAAGATAAAQLVAGFMSGLHGISPRTLAAAMVKDPDARSQLARGVTSYQAWEGMHPTSVGSPDTYGTYMAPGTPLNDVA